MEPDPQPIACSVLGKIKETETNNSMEREDQKEVVLKAKGDLLEEAVKNGDASTVEFLLRQGAPVKESLLGVAVASQDLSKVHLLLTLGIDSFSEKDKQDALLFAVQRFDLDCINKLLDQGDVDPNFWTDDESCPTTPLHLAVKNPDVVELLLEFDANPNEMDARTATPLHLVGNEYRSARLLIQHGANPDNLMRGETALHIAVRHNYFETVKELAGADPNAMNSAGEAPLHVAVGQRNMPLIEWLVKQAGANPTIASKFPPLQSAFSANMRPKPLIELGMDPLQLDEMGSTVIHYAVASQNTEESFRKAFVAELLGYNPELVHYQDRLGNTPLHLARSKSMVELLVQEYGANLLAKNRHGRIPLTETLLQRDRCAFTWISQQMKKKGLHVDVGDENGWTPLHWAVFACKLECVKSLLRSGAYPNKRNSYGRSPLHLSGYPISVQANRDLCTYRDCDITRVVNTKELRWTIEGEHVATMQSLFDKHADATIRDKDGNLPFFLAVVTSQVSMSFEMIRVAAKQGLFGCSTQENINATASSKGAQPLVSEGSSSTATSPSTLQSLSTVPAKNHLIHENGGHSQLPPISTDVASHKVRAKGNGNRKDDKDEVVYGKQEENDEEKAPEQNDETIDASPTYIAAQQLHAGTRGTYFMSRKRKTANSDGGAVNPKTAKAGIQQPGVPNAVGHEDEGEAAPTLVQSPLNTSKPRSPRRKRGLPTRNAAVSQIGAQIASLELKPSEEDLAPTQTHKRKRSNMTQIAPFSKVQGKAASQLMAQAEQHVTQPKRKGYALPYPNRLRLLASNGVTNCRICGAWIPSKLPPDWQQNDNPGCHDKRNIQKICDTHGHPCFGNIVPKQGILLSRISFEPCHPTQVFCDTALVQGLKEMDKKEAMTAWGVEDDPAARLSPKLVVIERILQYVSGLIVRVQTKVQSGCYRRLEQSWKDYEPYYKEYQTAVLELLDEHMGNFQRGLSQRHIWQSATPKVSYEDIFLAIQDVFANVYLPSIVYVPLHDLDQHERADISLGSTTSMPGDWPQATSRINGFIIPQKRDAKLAKCKPAPSAVDHLLLGK